MSRYQSESDENSRLNEEELELLADALDVYGSEDGMDLEEVDGLFCALASGPAFVKFSEYLPEIFGGEPTFDDEGAARDICFFLMRHWNAVVSELEAASVRGDIYQPVMAADKSGVVRGNAWARGYIHGTHMRAEGWGELAANEDKRDMLLPMLYLNFEDHPDPELCAPSLPPEKRVEMIELMMTRVTDIYHYFAAHRRTTAQNASEKATHAKMKVGRNQPCPCGSGKKFKVCCGK